VTSAMTSISLQSTCLNLFAASYQRRHRHQGNHETAWDGARDAPIVLLPETFERQHCLNF